MHPTGYEENLIEPSLIEEGIRAVLTTEIYTFKDKGRVAKIIFEQDKGKFVFSDCQYSVLNNPYGLADWKFLNNLSGEILRLTEKVEND